MGQSPCLATKPEFVAAFLAFLRDEPRRLPATLWITLRDYPETLPNFSTLLFGLERCLLETGVTSAQVWRRRHDRYWLFNSSGPQKIAEAVLEHDKMPVAEVLTEAGFSGDLSTAGFLRAVHRRLLETVAKSLHDDQPGAAYLERPIAFIETERGRLRLAGLAPAVADALLLPHTEQGPLEATRECIQAFILRHLEDPRVFPRKWQGVSRDAQAVMLRWLVRQTLEDFFRLIGRHAWMNHWQYRAAFWHAYFRAGAISDARVSLGENARVLARQVFKLPATQFSRLSAGAQKDHSVLLLQIGSLVIAEWSHNGSCRVWNEGNRSAPSLREFSHDGAMLRSGADHTQIHSHSESYSWQRNLSEHIRAQTGIAVFQRDYRLP